MIRTISPLDQPDAGLEPVDFIVRLAALVPKHRVNLTRFHGVLASNHRWRELITPAKRGKRAMRPSDSNVVSLIERHAAMTEAQRLKRVFLRTALRHRHLIAGILACREHVTSHLAFGHRVT